VFAQAWTHSSQRVRRSKSISILDQAEFVKTLGLDYFGILIPDWLIQYPLRSLEPPGGFLFQPLTDARVPFQ
jgi:hypothetical protein